MYSYEISQILAENNYNIDHEIYLRILNSSPQIRFIHYDSFGDYFEMTDEENNYWKFNVYRKV